MYMFHLNSCLMQISCEFFFIHIHGTNKTFNSTKFKLISYTRMTKRGGLGCERTKILVNLFNISIQAEFFCAKKVKLIASNNAE